MSAEPKRPRLTARDKNKIQRLYMRGMPPRDICVELRSLALNPRTITNIAHRCGWGKQRTEITAAKAASSAEILERAKQDAATELEVILRDVSSGMKIDAAELKSSWHLVENAADASSLMRAKTLFMNQLLKFHGLAQTGGRSQNYLQLHGRWAIGMTPDGRAMRSGDEIAPEYKCFASDPLAVGVADLEVTALAAADAQPDDGFQLDFEDAHEDTNQEGK